MHAVYMILYKYVKKIYFCNKEKFSLKNRIYSFSNNKFVPF